MWRNKFKTSWHKTKFEGNGWKPFFHFNFVAVEWKKGNKHKAKKATSPPNVIKRKGGMFQVGALRGQECTNGPRWRRNTYVSKSTYAAQSNCRLWDECFECPKRDTDEWGSPAFEFTFCFRVSVFLVCFIRSCNKRAPRTISHSSCNHHVFLDNIDKQHNWPWSRNWSFAGFWQSYLLLSQSCFQQSAVRSGSSETSPRLTWCVRTVLIETRDLLECRVGTPLAGGSTDWCR